MRFALLADIHGNLEALERLETDLSGRRTDEILFLGDAVGYGANPNECFEWVLKRAKVFLMGNHEKAVIDPALRQLFNEWAYEAIVWTDSKLDKKFRKQIEDLPFVRIEKGMTLAHGTIHEPEMFQYLLDHESAKGSFAAMTTPVGFIGHTHIPSYFEKDESHVFQLMRGILKLEKNKTYIMNPGSVGQPRDHDSRLAYGIYDNEKQTFEIIRLKYDNEKAAEKIRRAGLPKYLAERLL